MRLLILLLFATLFLAACRADSADNSDMDIRIEFAEDAPAVGGERFILVTLSDSAGNPINNATVKIRGDMTHAGMTPIFGEATDGENGVYEVLFAFSMAGDWILTVDVTLPDGTTATETFNIDGVGLESPSNESGGISAAYFSVTNNGTDDIRLLSVTAEGVGASSIHQTVVENNVARMEEVEGGMLIPAGETVELAPSGHHVMLMNITTALLDGERLLLNLSFDNGITLSVEAPISLIQPDAGGSAEAENISVSGAWLRPSTGGE
jgi:periplasmic copper chaperone A